jgi:outer membrane protein OmpA-like peptidoglycan-associated protein
MQCRNCRQRKINAMVRKHLRGGWLLVFSPPLVGNPSATRLTARARRPAYRADRTQPNPNRGAAMPHARLVAFIPRARLVILSTALLLSTMSCARHAQRGLVIGAAGGAVVGGVIGKVSGSTAKGAIIGAAIGGAAGAIIGDQMDRQAAELKQNIPGATVERVGEGIQVTFASGLLYDFDSDVVKPTARENLRSLATSLEKYPGSELLILGHTDSVGTDAYNKDLSVRRADAAAEYLVAQGVARSRIGTGGLGEDEPVAPNADAAGRQRNRRVEVAIYAGEKLREEARRKAGG